jgi:glycosyltransferase involved in cell wall biosynthesis
MKVVIINKSDATGGAAVVSFRLMNALRAAGVDAHMLVAEKRTDSEFVTIAASSAKMQIPFLAERLKIYLQNGLNRSTLFKIDTATDGLPLYKHPLVKEADVICLNWVNQGILSFRGLKKLASLGKPIVWTMHDMWNMTGICHHAGECNAFLEHCESCPIMGGSSGLSKSTHTAKKRIYSLKNSITGAPAFTFVAVSNWLAGKAAESSLLGAKDGAASSPRVEVIPNAFPFPKQKPELRGGEEIRILFGAARLDDTVKGLPILLEATRQYAKKYPELAAHSRLITFGGVKNPEALSGFGIKHTHLGVVKGEKNVRNLYSGCDIVVSTSLYETLPGTLVEGQAYGCIPVAFNRGGQPDIIDHAETGFLAAWSDDLSVAGIRIADGIAWAAEALKNDPEILARMDSSARSRFSCESVAARYITLFNSLLQK